jgi:uncharacterized protein YutE (UPF0331/DUF86 family)
MPEFKYGRGRIIESIRFISEEMKEFQEEYSQKTKLQYQSDRKLQKLMDRTVENILTALVEVSGTYLAERGIAAESYADALGKCARELGLDEGEQDNLAALAIQRNRLAHRYLNFRWQAIHDFSVKRPLITKILSLLIKGEEENKA